MPLIKNASDDLRPIFSDLSLSHGATITRTFAYLTGSLFSFRNVHKRLSERYTLNRLKNARKVISSHGEPI